MPILIFSSCLINNFKNLVLTRNLVVKEKIKNRLIIFAWFRQSAYLCIYIRIIDIGIFRVLFRFNFIILFSVILFSVGLNLIWSCILIQLITDENKGLWRMKALIKMFYYNVLIYYYYIYIIILYTDISIRVLICYWIR